MRGRLEKNIFFNSTPLIVGGLTTFQQNFPLGRIVTRMMMRFNFVFAAGTGSGALTEAFLRIIENIHFSTDVDGLCVNAGGRALWRRAQFLNGGTLPPADAFTGSTGTYRVDIPIYFSDPRMGEFADLSALDTTRYNNVLLQISLGGLSRLLGTPGTATVTATVDIGWEQYAYYDEDERPAVYPFFTTRPSVNPNNQQFMELERSSDLDIKRIMIFTSDNTDIWQGTANSAVIATLSIFDNYGHVGLNGQPDDVIQRNNVETYSIDGGLIIPGLMVHDYVLGGDPLTAEHSGNKSRYQVVWTNDTPTGMFVHGAIDGVKKLDVG